MTKKRIKTAFYEQKKDTVDINTGEIISESKTTLSRYSSEPPYVKMYIDDICSMIKVPDSLKNVLFLMLRKLDYDGYMTLSTRYRKSMCDQLSIKDGTLRNRLALLVKKGFVLSEGGNEYLANPKFFARGEWKSIIEQRSAFELKIKYSEDGREITTERIL
ncbi:replication/maintenance protein RepL [Candidatus Arsenophonus triatominarum]|uniref:replication/maintenance protein RepL n=1 Tax=Candidatus Arsenophonus triatominarum TaxID=57911 RepID=UPI00164F9A18|nr:replication/maintenance protein RepL [Candidatus Arsenophonus triatominarum]